MKDLVDCEGKSSVLRRSIQHLIPLKTRIESNIEENTPIHDNSRSTEAPVSSSDDTTRNASSRPHCHAAVVGEINRQLNSLTLYYYDYQVCSRFCV